MSDAKTLTEGALDMNSLVTLREFAELEWQPLDEEKASLGAMGLTPEGRYSWLRKARSQGRGLPDPIAGSSRSSLYRLGDLVSWVESEPGPGGPQLRVHFNPLWALRSASSTFGRGRDLWSSLEDSSASSPLDELRHFLLGVLCLLAAEEDDPSIRNLVVEELTAPADDVPARLRVLAQKGNSERHRLAEEFIACVPGDSDAASRAARAVTAMALTGTSLAEIVDVLFQSFTGLDVRAGTTTTSQSLANFLVALGAPAVGDSVVDPACGEGQILLAVARHEPTAQLVGRDRDQMALLAAQAVLALNGAQGDLGSGSTDSLDATDLPQGDLVILDPPLGEGHVAHWLRLAARLAPEGRAVIVMPGNTLRPHRREWGVVADRVTAVIACPPRLRTDTGEAPAIWLLDRPGAVHGDVLVVDATALGSHGFGNDDLAAAVNTWRSKGRWVAPSGISASPVSREEIVARDGELRFDQLRPSAIEGKVASSDLARRLLFSLRNAPGDDSENLREALARYLIASRTDDRSSGGPLTRQPDDTSDEAGG